MRRRNALSTLTLVLAPLQLLGCVDSWRSGDARITRPGLFYPPIPAGAALVSFEGLEPIRGSHSWVVGSLPRGHYYCQIRFRQLDCETLPEHASFRLQVLSEEDATVYEVDGVIGKVWTRAVTGSLDPDDCVFNPVGGFVPYFESGTPYRIILTASGALTPESGIWAPELRCVHAGAR